MTALEGDVEIVQLPCPDCDFVAEGPSKGKGSAGFKLGGHRSNRHGYKNPNGPRRPTAKEKAAAGAPEPEGSGKPTVIRLVEAATAEISDRSSRAPSIEELTKAGARFFGAMSVGAASYLAETDPTLVTENEREAIVDHLSLEPEEARDLAYPLARAIGRSSINKRYGRAIVDNIDVGSAAVELVMIGVRYRRYFRTRELRMQQLGSMPGYDLPPQPSRQPMILQPEMMMRPMPANDDNNATAPAQRPGAAPMSGTVLTPEIVEKMLGANGRG